MSSRIRLATRSVSVNIVPNCSLNVHTFANVARPGTARHNRLLVDVQPATPLVDSVHCRSTPTDAAERGDLDYTNCVLYVLPIREQQSVVLHVPRSKVIAGLLHQHRPRLRSFHSVSRS